MRLMMPSAPVVRRHPAKRGRRMVPAVALVVVIVLATVRRPRS